MSGWLIVAQIVVQPNSPVPPAGPAARYVAQSVPLGPALYQPSLASMTKYQYKTPALSPHPAPAQPQYRSVQL